MIQTSGNRQRSAFSWWLRTGELPPVRNSEGVELKYNPWHDPADGRFTFAETGHRDGAGVAGPADRVSGRDDRGRSRTATTPKAKALRVERLATHGNRPGNQAAIKSRPKPVPPSRPGDQPNSAAEFIGGVGEGLYGVAEGTVAGAYSMLTTNPVTSVRNVGRGIAGMIDTAIGAEETPARVQISRAANAVAKASAREIGRAAGSITGNVVLAVAPGAALSKVSAMRRLRTVRPRVTYDPPQIGWVKENLGRDSQAKRYNDSATGSRPNQAPTLMRTMSDGSKRPVKFDGIQGDYVIDRKWKIVNAPHARAQLLRQSEVLAQHRLIGMWEVPTPVQRTKALKLLKRMNVTNIKVRVVKP